MPKVVKLTITDKNGNSFDQYVSPESARYAAKIQLEEGNSVLKTELEELPHGITLDIK
jgi:hypothetical protein